MVAEAFGRCCHERWRKGSGILRRCGRCPGCPDHLRHLRLNRTQRRDLILFCAPFAFYAVNEQIKYRVSAPLLGYLLRCHFNDYLGGIAFAAYLNLVISFSKWPHRRLRSPLQFIAAGLLCSVAWELITPLFLPSSTGDWLDVIAYVLGMLTYWLLAGRRAPQPPDSPASSR